MSLRPSKKHSQFKQTLCGCHGWHLNQGIHCLNFRIDCTFDSSYCSYCSSHSAAVSCLVRLCRSLADFEQEFFLSLTLLLQVEFDLLGKIQRLMTDPGQFRAVGFLMPTAFHRLIIYSYYKLEQVLLSYDLVKGKIDLHTGNKILDHSF